MYKNILVMMLAISVLTGCFSPNLLKFGQLDNDVANEEKIINNLEGSILTLSTLPDTESLSVVLPKDNLTVRLRIAIPNVEDVLYINMITTDEFKINKLVRRVSSLDELSLEQDGWVFEPSVEKHVVILQLYLPSVYLYTSQFSGVLNFAYKRDSRSLQDSIKLNFIKQQYFVNHNNDEEHEQPQYGDVSEYCSETDTELNSKFVEQISKLNKNRIDDDMIKQLKELCN